jgi:putative tryptophan/tyrosine transport system substrate-binding protein
LKSCLDKRARYTLRLGYIHSTYPSAIGDIEKLKVIAVDRDDVEFVPFEIAYRPLPTGIDAMIDEVIVAVKAMEDQIDFFWEPSGPLGETDEYTKAILENSNIPIVFGHTMRSVEIGALVHLAPDPVSTGYEAAYIAAQILSGADAGDIPVNPPTGFRIGVNITTALKLRVVIPSHLLKLVGENLYR